MLRPKRALHGRRRASLCPMCLTVCFRKRTRGRCGPTNMSLTSIIHVSISSKDSTAQTLFRMTYPQCDVQGCTKIQTSKAENRRDEAPGALPAPNDIIDLRFVFTRISVVSGPIRTIDSVLKSHGPRASFELSILPTRRWIRLRLNHTQNATAFQIDTVDRRCALHVAHGVSVHTMTTLYPGPGARGPWRLRSQRKRGPPLNR